MTAEDGEYSFTVPAARASGQAATLEARRLGFRPVSVPGDADAGHHHHARLHARREPAATRRGRRHGRRHGHAGRAHRHRADAGGLGGDRASRTRRTSSNALAAKAPGVTVTSQSGSPGASASIRIRGLNTIQGTGQPLFVVDGTPIDNSTMSTTGPTGSTDTPNRAADINPEDIASVEILKSGAAAAIYGARAGQGVVLITTKSGKPTGAHHRARFARTSRVDQLYRSGAAAARVRSGHRRRRRHVHAGPTAP